MAKVLPSPKKGKKYLTPKKKKFIDAYIKNGGNATEAAWEVCDVSTRAAASTSGQYMKNACKEEIDQRLAKYGLTEELVFKRHKQIIEKGKDQVAMDGIKTFYKLVTKEDETKDKEVTINLNF